jgi:hypothetical protein
VVVEDFPGYAPELNPDEGVWGWTKYGRIIRGGTCRSALLPEGLQTYYLVPIPRDLGRLSKDDLSKKTRSGR